MTYHCIKQCVSLLKMRADLLFHRGFDSYHEAIHHLQELLSRKPGTVDYKSLVSLNSVGSAI